MSSEAKIPSAARMGPIVQSACNLPPCGSSRGRSGGRRAPSPPLLHVSNEDPPVLSVRAGAEMWAGQGARQMGPVCSLRVHHRDGEQSRWGLSPAHDPRRHPLASGLLPLEPPPRKQSHPSDSRPRLSAPGRAGRGVDPRALQAHRGARAEVSQTGCPRSLCRVKWMGSGKEALVCLGVRGSCGDFPVLGWLTVAGAASSLII